MAATRKTTTKKDDAETAALATPGTVASEVQARGGWDVGYVGDSIDDTPNEAYTVTGVLKAAD